MELCWLHLLLFPQKMVNGRREFPIQEIPRIREVEPRPNLMREGSRKKFIKEIEKERQIGSRENIMEKQKLKIAKLTKVSFGLRLLEERLAEKALN